MKTNNKLYNMKNKYLRLVVVLSALLLSVSSLWAERVTQEDAALVAANFLNAGDTTSQGAQAPGRNRPIRRVTLSEEAQYYVYANADGNGWVMIAANDVARPIIAYSDEGEFRADNQPANIKCWLGKYNKQIKQAEADGVQATEEVKSEWKQLRKGTGIRKGTPVVAALIKTKWDQDDPYWNLCPMKGNSHDCYTGCVATAMAQVMNYWQWPVKGTGSYSYTTETLKLSASADFANTTYDWDNMLEKYNGYYPEGSSTWTTSGVPTPTTAQKNAVATLMYHCGVAVAMDYNVASAGGSGAQTVRPNASSSTAKCAQNALYQNFGYKSSIKGYYRPGGYGYSAVSDANWHNYLKTELDAARPIMYAGSDDEGGHSFICDGYDNTTPTRKYHFNWGWSGYCDGYYDVDALVPGTGGSGSGNGSYNDDQDIIIGIVPDKPDLTITWSVQGVTSTTTQTSGTLVLPATTPVDCASGKKFVGWTASSSLSGSAPDDLFTSGSGITVTENKTYYAVYAAQSGSGTPTNLIAYDGADGLTNLTAIDGVSNNGVGSYASSNSPYLLKFDGTGDYIQFALSSVPTSLSFDYKMIGGANASTMTIQECATVDGTYSKVEDLSISGSQNSTGTLTTSASFSKQYIRMLFTKGSNVGVGSITITGGGATYSDYSLTCGTPCSNTPSMSFSAPTTISKTTADGSFTKAVTISGKGDGQTVAYSSSDETVATVNSSGVVTLQGKGGSTTITASVEANGTYCAASASYTINVTAAPINVTLYYNNTSATLNNQTPPYTLPTTGTYVAAMCDGDWTFDGWLGSTYTKSETKPTYITQLDATGSAYAVYKTTETTSGASVRKAKMGTTDDVLDLSFTGVSGTSYSAWSGKTGTSGAVYAGNSAGGNDAIQLRSNNSNSGIVTTTTGGTATKVVVTWNSSTDNARSITIYGKNTAYSSAADLYSSSSTTQGTSLGTISKGSTTLNITGSYAYIGIRSTSGALYLDDVTITWSSSGGTTTKTYYATSPDCAVACALTGITLNTSSVTKTFTQDGEFNSTGLVVTASYSNCADKTVSANVTAPSLATTGEKTVTVSYTEGGVTKEATYKINVVAPYTVTYKVCGEVHTTQSYAPSAALVLPEEPGGFDGLTFAGWTATEHHTGASAPADLFSTAGSKTVTADVTYYAVFH